LYVTYQTARCRNVRQTHLKVLGRGIRMNNNANVATVAPDPREATLSNSKNLFGLPLVPSSSQTACHGAEE